MHINIDEIGYAYLYYLQALQPILPHTHLKQIPICTMLMFSQSRVKWAGVKNRIWLFPGLVLLSLLSGAEAMVCLDSLVKFFYSWTLVYS